MPSLPRGGSVIKQELLNKLLQSPRLPSLPTIAIEVIELVQHQDVNIKQIAHTISHDPALSTKILRTVNSSFYGQAHSISTISHALVVLGLNSVKTLALGFSLVNNIKDAGGEGFDHVLFWKRSLYSAVAARSLALQFGLVQQEEAFLGGLLQDLGMLAMNQTLGMEYHAIVSSIGTEHRKLAERELQILGIDHAEVGGALAEHWHLPPILRAPIRYHENIEGAPADLLPLIRSIHLGGRVADVFISESPGEALDQYYRCAEEWFQLPREQAEALLKNIHKNTVEMRRLFDLPTGELENPDVILGRANEALLQISLQQQQQTTQLEQQNRQLVEQASTDSLTGAANRRRFNEFIAGEFTKVRQNQGPMCLLFLDTDHFKKFNDTYGHQTGDRVLVELATVLKTVSPERGLVARYGGEEFAVVIPKMDRIEAAKLAEQMRQKISEATVESDEGQPLHITASIGVACDDGSFFTWVEQFIKAADQGVYAAKASGRNCVRIFTPKPKAAVPPPGAQASKVA
jgi:diguanylate cyclase (GGDEF)-like protein